MKAKERILTPVLIWIAVTYPTLGFGSEEATPLVKAREAFELQLQEARAAGVVVGRKEPPGAPPLRDAPDGAAAAPAIGAECLSLEGLERSEHSLGDDPVAAFDRLRGSLVASGGSSGANAEIALAKGYLVLGFAEEARAIALAQEGAEAAGLVALALLAENRPQEVAQHITNQKGCDANYRPIKEVAAVLLGERKQLSADGQEYLARLPFRVRQPIAEALTASALAKGVSQGIERQEFPLEKESAEKSEAASFIKAAADPNAESGIPSLLEIGATPGRFRLDALHAVALKLDDSADPELKKAFDADSEDVLGDTNGGEARANFSLLIARRRTRQGRLTAAAKALAVAYGHGGTRDEALGLYRELIAPLIRSSSSDDRLSALSIIAEYPQLAAESLPPADIKSAAGAVAQLGAVKATNRIISYLALPPAEIGLLKAEASFHAGDTLGARSALEPLSGDPSAVKLLARVAISSGERNVDRSLSIPGAGAEAAEFHWNAGDLDVLRAPASEASLTGEAATNAVLAHLAADSTPTVELLRNVGDMRVAALFEKAPTGVAADAAADFSNSVSQSIDYLREALRND